MENVYFTALGIVIGFGLALFIGYAYGKKRPRGRDLLARELDKFFTNHQRNTLAELRRLNPERCKAFGHTIQDMHVTFWATELAGETGELCNWIKKMVRGDQIPDIIQHIGREAGDVVCTLDLLCQHLGINLEEWTIKKFNEVSDRVNSPLKLK
jgi:NTP pyrophosphatase (non-canonical NTP hydrolase)